MAAKKKKASAAKPKRSRPITTAAPKKAAKKKATSARPAKAKPATKMTEAGATAIALAEASPKRAFTAAREAVKGLGDTPAAIEIFDRVADACVAKSTQWAAEAFRAARAIDRRLGRPLDVSRYVAFAARGALDPRDLVDALADENASRADLVAIAVDAIAGGHSPTSEIIEALLETPHGPILGDVFRGWLARGVTLPTGVWIACADVAKEILTADPSLAEGLITHAHDDRNPTNALALLALLAPFIPSVSLRQEALRITDENVTAKTLVELASIVRGTKEPLSVIPKPRGDGEADTPSWSRQLLDPAIVELLLSLDLKLRLPSGGPDTYTFSLYQWANRDLELDALERVGAHPFFARVLFTSFLPRRETKDNAGEYLARATERAGCARTIEELGAYIAKIPSSWTLGALDVHSEWLEGLLEPEILAAMPALAEAVRALDPAELFANQLRAGILDEWGWPAFDEALDRLGTDDDRSPYGGPFPYRILHDQEKHRLVAVGADRIEIDREYQHPSKQEVLRGAFFCEGDVLACSWGPSLGHWIETNNEPFAMDAYDVFDIPCEGALLAKAGTKVHRGEKIPRREDGRGAGRRAWFDGEAWFDVTQECILDAQGGSSEKHHPIPPISTFDPKTGERTGIAIPRFMRGLLTTPESRLIAHIQTSFVCPVPPGAEASPLGAKNGYGGFALVAENGDVIAHRIDGKSRAGLVNGLYVSGLMTFPERDALYPIVESAFDLGIAMPDGTPLVPAENGAHREYWGGTHPLRLLWFHLLRPRDRNGSHALANVTSEKARAIVEAANPGMREPEVVKQYHNMQAVMAPAAKPTKASAELIGAIERALPEVTHPRLKKGIAALAQVAVRQADVVTRLQSRLGAEDEQAAGGSKLLNADASAIARLFEHQMHWWIEKLGKSLGRQIEDVARYLFESNDTAPRTPAPTVFPWELIVTRLGELLYRFRAPGTPSAAREEIARVLRLWSETAFAKNAARMRLVVLRLPPSAATAGIDREHPDRLVTFEDRFFLRYRQHDGDRLIVRGIQATMDGVFHVPPGADLIEAIPSETRFAADAILRTLERPPALFDRSIAERISEQTGLAVPSATLLWAAGYDPWLATDSAREKLGIDRKSLAVAEAELEGKRLSAIYEKAMPDDPNVADRMAEAYNAMFGKSASLPVALLELMRDDLKAPGLPLERDARTLVEPRGVDLLWKDETWVMRPAPPFNAGNRRFHGFLPPGWPKTTSMPPGDENPDRDDFFQPYALSRFVRYLAWAHFALPGGDVARAGAALIGKLLRERLANPNLLVLAGIVDLSTTDSTGSEILGIKNTVTEEEGAAGFASVMSRFEGEPYASAPGVDRGDVVVTWAESKNGIFIAFRPNALATDEALLRFLDDVGAGAAFRRTNGGTACPIAFGSLPVIAPAAFSHWLVWRTAGFQRLVDDLSLPLTEGRFASDPRVVAPEAVKAIRDRHGLDEEAATLFLQECVLPDARAERIMRFNGWDRATYDRARGAIASLQRTAKKPLYGIAEDDEPVFGVLLPLRPLREMFADAAKA